MSGPEFFNPSEGGESYDPQAFERFKEQIKKNAASMAAAQKSEQKQKQKEDRLAKLLLKFIQTHQKSAILFLASKLLAQNIPASFILSIIILGHEDIAEEMKKELQGNLPQLKANRAPNLQETHKEIHAFSIMPYLSDNSLPLKLKAEIDEWVQEIFNTASAVPFQLLERATDDKGNVKRDVIECAAHVLREHVQQEQAYATFYAFCELFLKAVMKQMKRQLESQRELSAGDSDGMSLKDNGPG